MGLSHCCKVVDDGSVMSPCWAEVAWISNEKMKRKKKSSINTIRTFVDMDVWVRAWNCYQVQQSTNNQWCQVSSNISKQYPPFLSSIWAFHTSKVLINRGYYGAIYNSEHMYKCSYTYCKLFFFPFPILSTSNCTYVWLETHVQMFVHVFQVIFYFILFQMYITID